MTRILQPRFLVAVLLIVLAAVYRMVPYDSLKAYFPYMWNLAPVGAMCLFAGACISNRLLALVMSVILAFLCNVVLGLYAAANPDNNVTFQSFVFHDGFWVNYIAFGLYVLIGYWLRNRRRAVPIGLSALAGSIQFFVVSNFGVWAFQATYPKTWTGLMDCYVAAIPFSRGTFISDQVFAFALFGIFALIEWGFPKMREPALQAA